MNSTYKIVLGLITVVIIVAAVFAYISFANSSSPTPSASPSATPTVTANPTATPIQTSTPTSAPTSTLTATPAQTAAPTATPAPTQSSTTAPTATPVQASTPTAVPTATPSPAATATPTPAPTATPTPTPVPTPTPFPYTTPGTSITVNGAGATFPLPFINATISQYQSQVIKSNLLINYQGVGSGAGINSLTAKTVDFAASDSPMSDSQRTAAPNVLHIPETIGAVTLAYNLPGIPSGLHLTGTVVANIFLGTITNWNDPAITALNPSTPLPNHAITTVHRSDGSGTTNIFTRYLCNVSSTWNTQVGFGTAVQWPGSNSLGASGNAAVASTINQTQYAIGYVELTYALQNGIPIAQIQNPSNNWIAPSLVSTVAAVASGASQGLPTGDQSWYNVSLLNTADPQAYPIVGFTYLLVYKELNVIPGMDQAKATQLVQFLWYITHDAQQLSPSLYYAQLPANVVQIDENSIRSISFNGQHLIS